MLFLLQMKEELTEEIESLKTKQNRLMLELRASVKDTVVSVSVSITAGGAAVINDTDVVSVLCINRSRQVVLFLRVLFQAVSSRRRYIVIFI